MVIRLVCTDCAGVFADAAAAHAHQSRLAFQVSFITVEQRQPCCPGAPRGRCKVGCPVGIGR